MEAVSNKTNVRALGQGINLTEVSKSIPQLESLCNRKIEAQDDFKTAIQVCALQAGILPRVLSQYIVARCTDSVKKKARSVEQLSLLFADVGG